MSETFWPEKSWCGSDNLWHSGCTRKPQSTTFHFASPNGQPQLNCRDKAKDVHTMDLAVKRNSATPKEPPHYLVSASINATFSTLGLANQCRTTCAGRPNNPQQRTQTKIPWLIIMSPCFSMPICTLHTHTHMHIYNTHTHTYTHIHTHTHIYIWYIYPHCIPVLDNPKCLDLTFEPPGSIILNG